MIHQSDWHKVRRGVPVLLLIIIPVVVYSNTLHNAYHLDDVYRIVDNPELERIWPPWRHFLDPRTGSTLPTLVHFRPLLPLTLSINHGISDALGIDRLVGLHVGNIAIHLLTSVLLFFLFRELLGLAKPSSSMELSRRDLVAFFAALLWSVHPVSGIPVNYLSARDLLLMQLFLVAALLAWVRMRLSHESLLRWLGIGILAAMSLLSKETGVVLVLLILLLELLLLRGKPSQGSLSWMLGGGIVAVGVYVAVAGHRFTEWLSPFYGLVQFKVHLAYLRNVVWPFEARLLAEVEALRLPVDQAMLAGMAVVASSLYLAWRCRRRMPIVAFCIVAYWTLLAPTSSVLALTELANDYRPYPAMAFLCFLLVTVSFTWIRGRAAIVVTATCVLYLAVASYTMNGIWETERTLYSHIVRNGGISLAHVNLARSLQDPVQAEHHYLEALARQPNNIYARINLGILRVTVGRIDEGIATVEQAVEIRPHWAITHHWLSQTYATIDRLEEAAEAGRRAVELEPRNVFYLYGLVLTLQKNGEFAASLPYLERLRQIAPGYKRSRFHEGFALQMLGRWDEAAASYGIFLKQHPRDTNAMYNLAYGRMNWGDFVRAIEGFERVIELDRGMAPAAHHWLTKCHEATGNVEAAQRHASLGRPPGQNPWTPDGIDLGP